MIDASCTVMVERILPEIRKRSAKALKDEGWKQTEIADAVGVTQAMVSRYLFMESEHFDPHIDAEISATVEKLVKLIKGGAGDAEMVSVLCEGCFSIREKGLLCPLHPVENCRVCMNIRSQRQAVERREILDDVIEAVRILEGHLSERIIPEVRINIASALPGAKNPSEVAAIPGRLVEIKGKVMALTGPEFGVSRHLSGILLSAMDMREDIRAAVNILFNEDVEKVLKNLGIEFAEFDGENIPGGWCALCLADRGAYGREPCLYVFGESAVKAAEIVKKISKEMER